MATSNPSEKYPNVKEEQLQQDKCESAGSPHHPMNTPRTGDQVGRAWRKRKMDRMGGSVEVNTSRLCFLLQATYDVLPSPANLVRWKVQEDDKLRFGKHRKIKHYLPNCYLLEQTHVETQ